MTTNQIQHLQTCQELLSVYNKQAGVKTSERLTFSGVGNRDVYNISAPFEDEGELVIAGRVERRDTEFSEVIFFVKKQGVWVPRSDTQTYKLQDPFVTKINGELLFGGVEVLTDPVDTHKIVTWRTVFYRGSSIRKLEQCATGPSGMKDVRLVGLPSGEIGVCTRPRGAIGGKGQIGFIRIPSLDQLNIEHIEQAHVYTDLYIPQEWGGANELHLLSNGLIGVLGHVASMEDGYIRHYHAMTFAINPLDGSRTPMKIIAVRSDFAPGPSKRLDLQDVIFSGGIIRGNDGKAEFYAGVSDAEAHSLILDDPFLEYEKL